MKDDQLHAFFPGGFYEEGGNWECNELESRSIAEKSIRLLGATEGHILDWCGGRGGRISRHLAAMGYKITILDFTEKYLSMAQKAFPKGAELTLIHKDCRKTPATIQADYALCTFNSVGFFPDDEQLKAFISLHNALKPKGRIILDCISQLFVAKHFQPVMERQRPDGVKIMRMNRFDLMTSTFCTDFQLADIAGKTIGKMYFEQRLYTPLELRNLLKAAGFSIMSMHGDFDGSDMALDLPQIVAIAQRN